jgi:hypothetical protein
MLANCEVSSASNSAVQIARQAVLRLDQRNLFFQAAGDAAQLHVLAGLDAEQHLRDELLQWPTEPAA